MCECGCAESAKRYTLTGPRKSFYVVALYPGCDDCDVGTAITIERIDPGHTLYESYKEEFTDGPLRLRNGQASITTGLKKREFVKKLAAHLIGVESKDFGEKGKIDEYGAEAILEEMFEDAQVRPRVVR